ncbi:MAG: hypothetical protein ACTHJ4_05980 [Candidatus Nucleicultricaceae bacterium]
MVLPIVASAIALGELAPVLSKWFGAGEGATQTTKVIASQVVDLAKKLTGSPSAETAIASLKEDPKALIAFQKAVISMDRDLERAYLNDRISARKRDMTFAQNGKSNIRGDIMVISAALGLLLCLFSLAFYRSIMPGEAVGIISTIAGIFGSCLKDAYAFEFGSSRGSKEKDMAVMMTRLSHSIK